MKKLLLVTLEFPPLRGGIAEYLYGLFSALPSDRVAVLTEGAGPPPPAMFHVRHGSLLGSESFSTGWLTAFTTVSRALKEEGAEMLAVSHILPMGYVALVFKWIRKVPYVVFLHGTDLNFASRSAWKRFWTRRILKGADLIVTNSRFTAGLAERAGAPPAKIEVIYPCPAIGHSTVGEASDSKHDMAMTGQRRVLLSVGRLTRRKGFDRVIRALAILRRACGDVIYVLVGDGPEQAALEREAARANLNPFVMFRHNIPRGKLNEYFSAADAFVLPGRELAGDIEGFGIVLVEAAAHGLPVVTTAVGGAPEAVVDAETGIILPENVTDQALAEQLCGLLMNRQEASRMGENGRRRVREMFTWPTQALKLRKRLEQL